MAAMAPAQHSSQRQPPTVLVVLYSDATPSPLHAYIKNQRSASREINKGGGGARVWERGGEV